MNSNIFGTKPSRALGVLALATLFTAQSFAGPQDRLSKTAYDQIKAVYTLKASLSSSQKKMDMALALKSRAVTSGLKLPIGNVIQSKAVLSQQMVAVEVYGRVTPQLLESIQKAGGTVKAAAAEFGVIDAIIPVSKLETVAGRTEVRHIGEVPPMTTNSASRGLLGMSNPLRTLRRLALAPLPMPAPVIGSLTSQAYISHGSNVAVANGYNGAGVKVGVLSDSASPGRVAALMTSGDLGPGTTVLAGQAGSGSDEGTAMMEIVQDMAPGSQVYFATAFNGVASFANNIVALKNAGCKVIVDDVSYFNEGVFQDGPIAQAVNSVTAAGVIYFSSAANSGNVTNGTAGCWEGDFADGGAVSGPIATAGETGRFHNFGALNYDVLTAATSVVTLKWSDPLGGSTNDYDLFALNSTGTTLTAFSAAVQNGTQDPYEQISNIAVNSRLVIVKFSGNSRALHMDTHRGRLSVATTGSVFGHNGGLNTVSSAATYWNSAKTGTKPFTGAANPVETFSSDGPRRIFYTPAGAQITAGNVLFATSGGQLLQKPDMTGADGVFTATPGFKPFYGTSAAAPHLAGLAALVVQAKPAYTPAQTYTALKASALDNMAAGWDRDGGWGIPMAMPAVNYALSH